MELPYEKSFCHEEDYFFSLNLKFFLRINLEPTNIFHQYHS